MSSEISYARRSSRESLEQPAESTSSWTDHEMWQRAGESRVEPQARAPRIEPVEQVVPRVEQVVEPGTPATAVSAPLPTLRHAVEPEPVTPAAIDPVTDVPAVEAPEPVEATAEPPPQPAKAADGKERRAGPRLRRRREIGRSLFSTFDMARRRCGGRAAIRMGGF